MSGAAAARHILDGAGLQDVAIQVVGRHLSDHYDPRERVLRLSEEVYYGQTAAAIGIAAHEAGHALQHAQHYAPLVIRNAAVPLASFGGNIGILLLIVGVAIDVTGLVWAGIVLFGGVAFFQIVNLPVEFNASSRAKDMLIRLGLAGNDEMIYVRKVLNAAALTYVAGTLQSVLTLLYYILRFTGGRRSDSDQ
jgi:Zn-dependent membrane protease YugP